MKRNILFVFAIAAILQKTFAHTFSAVAPTGQTLCYDITTYGTATVVPPEWGWNIMTRPTDSLVIPDSVVYGGTTYRVTAIGTGAFYGCTGLTTPNTYW